MVTHVVYTHVLHTFFIYYLLVTIHPILPLVNLYMTLNNSKPITNIVDMWERQITHSENLVADMRQRNEPHEKIDAELTWMRILRDKVHNAKAPKVGEAVVHVV